LDPAPHKKCIKKLLTGTLKKNSYHQKKKLKLFLPTEKNIFLPTEEETDSFYSCTAIVFINVYVFSAECATNL